MNKKIILTIFLAIGVVLLIFFLTKALGKEKIEQPNQEIPKENTVEAINGVKIAPEALQRPFAVVVENHVDSRPQSGLSQADLVYEALAEGGITRYMAIYQTPYVPEGPGIVAAIGPIRSARTYFNDWAQELKAIYFHVGGNSDALYYLAQGLPGVSDANEFYNGKYFRRSTSRSAPHNTYISTEQMLKLAEDKGFSLEPTYSGYSFKEDSKAALPEAASITIPFSTASFETVWTYDPATNMYLRSLAGKKDIDAGNNKQITAKNIVVQYVKNWPVQSDTPFSISMGTREGGNAEFFLDGKSAKGTWRYENNRTKFFDPKGNEMKFNRGQIWISVVPPENIVSFVPGAAQ